MGNFSDRHHCPKVCVYDGTDGRRGGEQLVAVGSRHLESAQAFAQQYGIPRCYDSYEALAAGLLRAETIVYGERQLRIL